MDPGRDSEDLELRHYLDVIRRRKVSLLVTVSVVLIATIAFTLLKTPEYRSTAEILVEAPLSERIFTPAEPRNGQPGADTNVATQVAILESRSVREAAEKAVGRKFDVEVARIGDTEVVAITATAGKPDEATRLAQAYTDAYLSMRRGRLTTELRTTTDAIKAEIDVLGALVAALDTRVQDLNTRVQAAPERETRAPLEAERDQLTQERAGPATRRSDLQQRLDRLQLASTLTKTGGVEVVSQASRPEKARPVLLRNLALALALGLLLGVVVAFLREHFDDTVKSESDLQRILGKAPLLGVVPVVRGWRSHDEAMLVSRSEPRSPASEAYSGVRTALELAGLSDPGRVLQVTSAGPGDGKTTTLSNLGVSFARTGRRTVLIDCNLRRPRLHTFFDLENSVGLTSVLQGEASLPAAFQPVPDESGLLVLTSGPAPASPSELLSTASIERVISSVAKDVDVVLVDGPPLPVPEAVVLADRADAVLLVVCAGRTTGRNLTHAAQLLHEIQCPLVGVLLNASRDKAGHGLTYGREALETMPADP